MRHLMLTLAYRGTEYHGFQVQHNKITVCQVVQDAIQRVFGSRLDIKGCSRTDAGVHANGFVLTFVTEKSIACQGVVEAMNIALPGDVAVKSCREVPTEFHPRYDCLGKRYLYQMYVSRARDPFLENLALQVRFPIDAQRMQQAASYFLGTHDFSAFCSAGGSVEDKVRTIYQCSVIQQGERLTLAITGDGFLYNMVRIIAGTLLEVGRGKLMPEEIPQILQSGDRTRAGATALACGLYLDKVFYAPPVGSGLEPFSTG